MSANRGAPGGLSAAAFEAMATETGSWLWGTAQGAYNHKATLSQIIVDAVIGMIPLVGDVTAARDLLAVSTRLIDDPRARESKLEWLLLAVLLLALIPVFGGVAKGVGRLVIKAAGEAGHLAGAARAAKLGEAAREIVAFLNRVGAGHAERWLLRLRFADHQVAIEDHFGKFVYTVNGALVQIERRLGTVLGDGLRQRIDGLMSGLGQLKVQAREMIPLAVKELDATLREIQHFVHSGGQTTSRVVEHTVMAGDKAAVTMTDELRMAEGMSATRSARGGVLQNKSLLVEVENQGFYRHEPGYPDLTAYAPKGRAPQVASFGGKIVNRPLEKGETIYRVFGPEGVTHSAKAPSSHAPGSAPDRANFWGLGAPPHNAEQWRKESAVLDEWNRDSYIVVGTIKERNALKACTGKIAEQRGMSISGQYLPGGGKQAIVQLPLDVNKQLRVAGDQAIATGKPVSFDYAGISWTVKPTGWKDANGIHGYDLVTLRAGVQTARLAAREEAVKDDRGGAQRQAMKDYYRLPDPSERKRLFRLIRQYSSWTACESVRIYHKAFVDVVKAAFDDTQANPPAEGPLLHPLEMAGFLGGYASMEGALARLRQGNKSVFKFIGYGATAAPYFCEAYRHIDPWCDGFLGDMFAARGMDVRIRVHPTFPQIEAALKNLVESWSYLGVAMETRFTDQAATIQSPDLADASGIGCGAQLAYSTIPPAEELPEVPETADQSLIKSGVSCPFTGIWEPVKVPLSKGFAGLFKRPEVPPDHQFELDGCMNYLHQGSPAPKIAFEGDGPRGEGRATVWRLLWKDDRYFEGAIPTEEATYQFIEQRHEPVPLPPPPKEPLVPTLMSGQLAPFSGEWVCTDPVDLRINVEKGDALPYTAEKWTLWWTYAGRPEPSS